MYKTHPLVLFYICGQVSLKYSKGYSSYRVDKKFYAKVDAFGRQEHKDGSHGGHLGLPIGVIFYLQIAVILPTKFKSREEEAQNRFSRWQPFGSSNNFSYICKSLPTKFRVNWPFGSGEEVQNRFIRQPPWWPSWVTDWNDFTYF